MKIKRYKFLGNGRYKVKIGETDYIIYEDIIIKHKILTKEEITQKELDKYLKDNVIYEAYYKALEYIKIKLRTEKEIETYLKKHGFSNEVIEKVTDKLNKDGYLNQKVYAEAYINDQINLKTVGPLKIKQELEKLGIEESIINQKLENYSKEQQLEKIQKLVEKEINLNTNKSSYMLKNKILVNLLNKGFYKDDILEVLDNIKVDDKKIYEKEYKKLYEKYSKKYSGKELEYKIREKMYKKGFRV